jgi:hypothetical protein
VSACPTPQFACLRVRGRVRGRVRVRVRVRDNPITVTDSPQLPYLVCRHVNSTWTRNMVGNVKGVHNAKSRSWGLILISTTAKQTTALINPHERV